MAKDLRKSGIKTAVLTNRIRPLAFATKILGSVDDFSPVIYCTDIGHRKPAPQPYRHMLGALQLQPAECIYVDNREENLQTARSLGMQVVLAGNTVQTAKDIKKILAIK